MCLNGLDEGGGAAIVQEEQPLAKSPQRGGTELVSFRSALYDSILQIDAHLWRAKSEYWL
jgi:hypothetical protein